MYGSLLWTKIGHLAFHTNLYPITVFGWIPFPQISSIPVRGGLYFGSIIMDRVFWIDYCGSCILDRVFWIDYCGSIIMDRVFWIVYFYYGSCILDRLLWIDYFGSCILDRLLWIVYFGWCILDRIGLQAGSGNGTKAGPEERWRWRSG